MRAPSQHRIIRRAGCLGGSGAPYLAEKTCVACTESAASTGERPAHMTSLNAAALGRLSATVGTPRYDRAAISAGIVHFGVGAFHRAHEAMFIDHVLALGFTDWGICGVGVLEGDRAVRDALRAQDTLYTLVTSAPDGTSVARVIGSIHEYLYAPDDPNAVLDRLADPGTRIVSLTITEGGYSIDDA